MGCCGLRVRNVEHFQKKLFKKIQNSHQNSAAIQKKLNFTDSEVVTNIFTKKKLPPSPHPTLHARITNYDANHYLLATSISVSFLCSTSVYK